MVAAETTEDRASGAPRSESLFDGFVSYSHAADGLLAPRLQSGLQRFAKPWWKTRAVRVFRDETSLAANPHLWGSITDALDRSEWLILLLSPEAAASEWINKEVAYWREHKRPDRILPVVTGGVSPGLRGMWVVRRCRRRCGGCFLRSRGGWICGLRFMRSSWF